MKTLMKSGYDALLVRATREDDDPIEEKTVSFGCCYMIWMAKMSTLMNYQMMSNACLLTTLRS